MERNTHCRKKPSQWSLHCHIARRGSTKKVKCTNNAELLQRAMLFLQIGTTRKKSWIGKLYKTRIPLRYTKGPCVGCTVNHTGSPRKTGQNWNFQTQICSGKFKKTRFPLRHTKGFHVGYTENHAGLFRTPDWNTSFKEFPKSNLCLKTRILPKHTSFILFPKSSFFLIVTCSLICPLTLRFSMFLK